MFESFLAKLVGDPCQKFERIMETGCNSQKQKYFFYIKMKRLFFCDRKGKAEVIIIDTNFHGLALKCLNSYSIETVSQQKHNIIM